MSLTTSSLWISGESVDTDAVADVVVGGTICVGSARVPDARIGTCQITNFAVLGSVTVGIHATFGN